MKVIYPTNGIWDGSSSLIDNDAVVPSGFTDVTPIQPAHALEFRDGQWVETATQDEINHWAKTHSDPNFKLEPTEPTETDKLKAMVGNLVAENAKKDQSIKQLQTMAGSLVSQVAELNKGGN